MGLKGFTQKLNGFEYIDDAKHPLKLSKSVFWKLYSQNCASYYKRGHFSFFPVGKTVLYTTFHAFIIL
jgi:hypothetical protein